MISRELKDMIEGMIDGASVSEVLDAIADICNEKCMHLRSNWNDEDAARSWRRDARIIERAISKIEN